MLMQLLPPPVTGSILCIAFKNVRAKGYTVYTNTVPTSCFRGFGNAQMTFVLESSMDMIAEQLKMDPAELRIKNGMNPGEVSIHGWEMKSCALKECVEKATEKSGWKEKRQKQEPFTGIGLACCNHVSGNRAFAREFDGSAGIVRIGRDGRVLVYHGESDMGQGLKTTYAMIVAERLGVPLEMVSVAVVDTDVSPFGLGTFATRGTVMGGNGVLAAAENAYQQLVGVAAEMLDTHPDDIECRQGEFRVRNAQRPGIPFKKVAEQAAFERMGAPIIGYGTYDPGSPSRTRKQNMAISLPCIHLPARSQRSMSTPILDKWRCFASPRHMMLAGQSTPWQQKARCMEA